MQDKVWMWKQITRELVVSVRLFIAAKMVHGDFYARNLLIRCDRRKSTLTCTIIDFEKAIIVDNEDELLFLNWCGLVGMIINLAYRNWQYPEAQNYILGLLDIVGHGIPLMFETPGGLVPNWNYIREWGMDTRHPNEHIDAYWHRKLMGTNVMVRKSAFANANKSFLRQVLMEMHTYAVEYEEYSTC